MDCDEIVEKHYKNLGVLLQNLLSLELFLRCCILRKECKERDAPNLTKIQEGDDVPECPLTNYDTLGDVIKKFNSYPDISHKIDKDRVCRIRDGIAHGRVLSDSPTLQPMRLVKFSKPRKKKVKVDIAIEMTDEWFKECTQFLFSEVQEIRKVYEGLSTG